MSFLFAILFTIPLAFDIGGRDCGLAFSLSLTLFYFVYSSLRLVTPDQSRFRSALVYLVASLQGFIIPGMLIWSLNKFSIDTNNGPSWVERTFRSKRAEDQSVYTWLLGRYGLIESVSIGSWDKLLSWSVPVFQLGEGFCSLLVIQAAGQITKWVVNREGGDNWMVSQRMDSHGVQANYPIDRPPCYVGVHYFQRTLFSLSDHHISRARQCGCDPYRCRNHMCDLPLRMGYWQWSW